MRYVTRVVDGAERLCFLQEEPEGQQVYDFAEAARLVMAKKGVEEWNGSLDSNLYAEPPHTLMDLLAAGDAWWEFGLSLGERFARLQPSVRAACACSGRAVAVLPQPRSIRDFFAFLQHVQTSYARLGMVVPNEWYESPAFYFSNTTAIFGHDEAVAPPKGSTQLDYELELAVIVRKVCRDAAPRDAMSLAGGLCLMNDWSARDLQAREMRVGLGPAKGKDFAMSLGPALVTWDELADRLTGTDDERGPKVDLGLRAYVNGMLLSEGQARDMHFTFGELLARASQDVTLYPGEVIGSGTVGTGCLLELGPSVHHWLQKGDLVRLEADQIGILQNLVV